MTQSFRLSLLGAAVAALIATPAFAKDQPLEYDWGQDDVKSTSIDHDWCELDLDDKLPRFGGKGPFANGKGDRIFDFEPGDFMPGDPKAGDGKHQLIRRQIAIIHQLIRELRVLNLLLKKKLKDPKGGDDGGADVPEPGTGLLLALAIGGGLALRRRRS